MAPASSSPLVEDMPLLEGQNGRFCSRIDVDVDAETLFS
jgi:hypothetical protein